MKLNLIKILICTLVTISCSRISNQTSEEEYDSVFVTSFSRDGMINGQEALFFKRNSLSDQIVCYYSNTTSISDTASGFYKFPVIINRTSRSTIVYRLDTCYFCGYKDYKIDNKAYRVNKYVFDRRDSDDEESEVLVNDSVGLVRVQSLVFGNYETYAKDSLSYYLNKCLSDDTTIFVMRTDNIQEHEAEVRRMLLNTLNHLNVRQ